MAMNGSARGEANYNAVAAANPNFDKLDVAEKNTLKGYFETLFGSDTTYITDNMDVLPASLAGESLSASIGIIGTVTSGAGSGGATISTAPGALEGKGSVQ